MKALPALFITVSLFAANIDDVIKNTLLTNPMLKKYENNIISKDYDIKNSDIYKNPVLTLGLNDISLDTPSERNLEPMQTNFISLSQEITMNDKLKLNRSINIYDKTAAKLFLEDKKDKLIQDIYTIFFQVNYLNNTIKILEKKSINIQKIQEYHNTHIQSAMAFQQSLQNDLSIEQLKLNINTKKEKIRQLYSSLEELSNLHITNLQKTISPEFKNDIKKLFDHKLVELNQMIIKQNIAKSDLAKENELPDPTVTLGYYNRVSYDDYVSLALKIPLNVYGKEKNIYLKSKVKIEEAKNELDALKNLLKNSYITNLSKLDNAQRSAEFTNNIISTIQKQIGLIREQNVKDSVIKILELENKLLDNRLMLQEFELSKNTATVNLSYLTSTLRKDKYE